VHASYVAAGIYVIGDAVHKKLEMRKVVLRKIPSFINRINYIFALQQCEKLGMDWWQVKKEGYVAAMDTLLWQSLASIIIPGFTINRLCASSLFLLHKYSKIAPARQKWITTAVGLASIPLIIKPIDHGVDYAMDNSVRKVYPYITKR